MKKVNAKYSDYISAAAGLVLGAFVVMGANAADTPATKATKDQAEANYEAAKARCDALSGNDKDVCIKEAKAAKTTSKANAEANEKAMDAKRDAQEDKLEAQYKVAKEKCDMLKGDEKDACQERAKAAYKH